MLPTGRLTATAAPWAWVVIDGKRVGGTPLMDVELPIGPHTVVFQHPRFHEQKRSIVVTATAPLHVSVDLRE